MFFTDQHPNGYNRGYLDSNEPLVITTMRIIDAFSGAYIFIAICSLTGTKPAYVNQAGFVIFVLICLFFHFHSIYRSFRFTPLRYEILHILYASTWLYVTLLFLAYGFGIMDVLPRNQTLAWMILWPAFMTSFRFLVRKLIRAFRIKGHNLKLAVVAGTGPTSRRLVKHLEKNAWSGIRVAGYFLETPDTQAAPVEGALLLGTLSQASEYIRQHGVEIIYIAMDSQFEEKTRDLIRELEDSPVSIHYVPNVSYIDMIIGGELINFDNWPIIVLRSSPIQGISYIAKQMVDTLVSLVALLLVSPLMLVIAMGVKLSSPGPVFYVQTRYGINGKPIRIYKFRTMTTCDDGSIFTQATKNDTRITRFGTLLRRTSLDELPQLINVLQGRMSLVGPRPHPVAMNEAYKNQVAGYRIRHRVKPGLTGLAQVKGFRGETDTLDKIEKRIEFDLKYIREWSLLLDCEIIVKTLIIFLFQKNAY